MKKNDADFTKLLYEHDVIFLYESWTCENTEIDLNGYFISIFIENSKINSGGTVVYI